MQPIILASTSAIRRTLLEDAGVAFTVMASPCDEDALKPSLAHLSMPDRALALAKAKAAAVAALHPDALVIGADQICSLGDAALSKPKTPENACAQLSHLAGKTHYQHSAACLMQGSRVLWQGIETATLTMKPLTGAEIAAYVALDNPLHASGGYYYEQHGHELFATIAGSREAILGLPLASLLAAIQQNQ